MPDFNLPDALNQYFLIGCKTFTRHELLAYGGMDFPRVANCLLAWEARGLIKMVKPIDKAEDAEITAKMLTPIGEFDLTEDSVFGLVDHSPEPIVVRDGQMLTYLTCDLPLGYPFETSISQLLLIQIRDHHRNELLYQQYEFLTLADQFVTSHPWLSYLAARKHEAVLAVMPGDSGTVTDVHKSWISKECLFKCKALRTRSREAIDVFTAHDCERLIAIQAEALRITRAQHAIQAAQEAGFSSFSAPVPPPLLPLIRLGWSLPLCLILICISAVGLDLTSGLVVASVAAVVGSICVLPGAVRDVRLRRTSLAIARTKHLEWLTKNRHICHCRDSLRLVSALIGLRQSEALRDLTRTLERLNALQAERCDLEARYIAPYGGTDVNWKTHFINDSSMEAIRYSPNLNSETKSN